MRQHATRRLSYVWCVLLLERNGGPEMNAQYLKDIASRCREIARMSPDPTIANKLIELSADLQRASEEHSSKAEWRPYQDRLG